VLDEPLRAKTAAFSSRKLPVSAGSGRPTTTQSRVTRVMRPCPSPSDPLLHDTPGINPLFDTDSCDSKTGFITTEENDTGSHYASGSHTSAAGAHGDFNKEPDQLRDSPNLEAILSRGEEIELENIECQSWHNVESISNDNTVLEIDKCGENNEKKKRTGTTRQLKTTRQRLNEF